MGLLRFLGLELDDLEVQYNPSGDSNNKEDREEKGVTRVWIYNRTTEERSGPIRLGVFDEDFMKDNYQ